MSHVTVSEIVKKTPTTEESINALLGTMALVDSLPEEIRQATKDKLEVFLARANNIILGLGQDVGKLKREVARNRRYIQSAGSTLASTAETLMKVTELVEEDKHQAKLTLTIGAALMAKVAASLEAETEPHTCDYHEKETLWEAQCSGSELKGVNADFFESAPFCQFCGGKVELHGATTHEHTFQS